MPYTEAQNKLFRWAEHHPETLPDKFDSLKKLGHDKLKKMAHEGVREAPVKAKARASSSTRWRSYERMSIVR